MAVFRIEKTQLHSNVQSSPAQRGAVAEIQRAALHDAVLAGGLELHNQGSGENLQGGHGQHRISTEGAGTRRVHSPQSVAGQQGQDSGCGVCLLRNTLDSSTSPWDMIPWAVSESST